MTLVLTHLWPCLLAAFLLGALLAWLLRRGAPAEAAAPDLSAYALRAELPEVPPPLDLSGFVRRHELPDLSLYAKRSELPAIPAAPDLSSYARRSDLPDLSGFLRRGELPAALDVSAFVHRSELPPRPPDLSGALAALDDALAAERAGRAADVARLEALVAAHAADHAAAPAPAAAPPPLAAEPVAVASPRPRRPRGPRRPDDLKLIHGVGPVLERRLHRLGVTRFIQIARWTDRHIDRIEPKLDSVPDRIRREGWVKDAARLHAEKYGPRRRG